MAVIHLNTGENWFVARWAFNGFLERVRESCGENVQLRELVERGMALDGIHFHLMQADMACELEARMIEVARRFVTGAYPPVQVEGRVLDVESQAQFLRAIEELLLLLKAGAS